MISWLVETWSALPDFILVSQIACALFFVAMALVIVRGGAAERLFFAVFITCAYLSHVIWAPPNTQAVYLGLIGFDLLALVACLAVALIFDRYWPMWLTIAQALSIIAEIVFLLAGRMSPYAYWNLSAAAFEMSSLALILGIMIEPPKRSWGWVEDMFKRLPLDRPRRAAG